MSNLVKIFASRRMAAMLLLGFSSGLPLAFTSSLLQAWMAALRVNLSVIGLFSLVGLPYAIKFLWAPVMDRFTPRLRGREALGRRRGWILLTQFAIALAVCALAFSNPSRQTGVVAFISLLVTFFSASQDTVIDAYRADLLDEEELGPGSALFILGYRVGMLASGALALILADHLPWRLVYLLMAALMGVGMATTLFAPEPRGGATRPKSLTAAVVEPFLEFFRRHGWLGTLETLSFTVLYKLGVVMGVALTTPFMLEMGFTKTDIGVVTKGFGIFAAVGGSLIAGVLMVPLGLLRSLWVFGVTQGAANLAFLGLAHAGHSYPWMVTSIVLDNLCSGMGNTAFMAFLMSLCDKRYSATQYALLSSLMALTRVVAGAPTGYLVVQLGWQKFFVLCTLAAAPGLALLLRYPRWARAKA